MANHNIRGGVFFLLSVLTVLVVVVFPISKTVAQTDYPTKNVTMIVPYSAGGATDVAFRSLSSVIPQYLGQALIVVNKPGAGGTVGASFAAKQRRDGYTLLAALQGPLILNPMQVKVDYSLADFEPIIHLLSTPLVLVAHPDVKWNTMQEMIQFAKDNPPGTVKFATTGFGNLPYVLTFFIRKQDRYQVHSGADEGRRTRH